MGSLENAKTWLIKHRSDALWLAFAGVFVVITIVLAYEVTHIEPLATSSTEKALQRFKIYHVPADQKCESCKQVEVKYALKPNSLASVTFSFHPRQETDDVVHISLNNLKDGSCKFLNYPDPPQTVQGERGDQISFPIMKDMKADGKERVISVGCELTVTVHAHSFTKFDLPFHYATAVASEKFNTPVTAPDPSARAPTQSTASPENGADTKPATALPEPPKKLEDFSMLMLSVDMHEVYAAKILFDDVSSKSVQLSPEGKVTMHWSSEELEARKELWLILIGICSAGAVASIIEALRPHIDRPKKKRNSEIV